MHVSTFIFFFTAGIYDTYMYLRICSRNFCDHACMYEKVFTKLGDVGFKLIVCFFSLLIWKWSDYKDWKIHVTTHNLLLLTSIHQSMEIFFGWHLLSKGFLKFAMSYNLTVCKVIFFLKRGFITEKRTNVNCWHRKFSKA